MFEPDLLVVVGAIVWPYTLANWLRRLRRNASLRSARFSLTGSEPLEVSRRARSGARSGGAAAQDGDVGGAVILAVAPLVFMATIFAERDVRLPGQGVPEGPMGAGGGDEDLGRGHL